MGAIADLLKSERGLFAVALVIAATVLAAMSIMTVDQWQDFAKFVLTVFTAGKTVTSTAAIIKGQASAPASTDTPS